jgi:hypothetical protein
MSLYLRCVIGPIVVCDIELFASKPDSDNAPPQLNGGTGNLAYPEVETPLGFGPAIGGGCS